MATLRVTQYVRPNRGIREVFVDDVPDDVALMVKGMVLSAEVLTTGEVMIYARFEDESPEQESNGLAQNGPGEKNPTAVLCEVIERKYAQRA